MEQLARCPICKTGNIRYQSHDGDNATITCGICGHFKITGSTVAIMETKQVDNKLSAYIRNYNITNPDSGAFEITSYTYKSIIESTPDYSPKQKQLFFLRALKAQTNHYGKKINLDSKKDYPLAWSENEEEFYFHLNELVDKNYVWRSKGLGVITLRLTTDGWSYLEENKQAVELLNQAFVAMSFNDNLLDVWNKGIKPAVEKAGYKALRVDQDPHIERIDAKIISDINDSLFIIADVTQQKQGVYFEAGYAMGLGKKVIWTVRKDDLDKVHFDTRQYAHIVWDTVDELSETLYYSIAANIGKRQ